MKTKTKLLSIAASAALLVGLSGCAAEGTYYGPDKSYEFTIELEDGTKVPCVKIHELYGYVCDFDKAIRATPDTKTPKL